MAYFRIKSLTLCSKSAIPGRTSPLIGISGCAGGVTGAGAGVVGSPAQESRTARHAIRILAIVIDLSETLRTRSPRIRRIVG
jgi:hypothetical protein